MSLFHDSFSEAVFREWLMVAIFNGAGRVIFIKSFLVLGLRHLAFKRQVSESICGQRQQNTFDHYGVLNNVLLEHGGLPFIFPFKVHLDFGHHCNSVVLEASI